MQQALAGESGEQALDYAVFQMKLHGLVREVIRVVECDGADFCADAPVCDCFASVARLAQQIERSCPGWVAGQSRSVGREVVSGRPVLVCLRFRFDGRGIGKAKADGDGLAEPVGTESHDVLRAQDLSAQSVDLLLKVLLSFPSSFQFFSDSGLAFAVAEGFDLSGQPIGLVLADAEGQHGGGPSFQHL